MQKMIRTLIGCQMLACLVTILGCGGNAGGNSSRNPLVIESEKSSLYLHGPGQTNCM